MGVEEVIENLFEEYSLNQSPHRKYYFNRAHSRLTELCSHLLTEGKTELPLLREFIAWRTPTLKDDYTFNYEFRRAKDYEEFLALIDEYTIMCCMYGLLPVKGKTVKDASDFWRISFFHVGTKNPEYKEEILYRLVTRLSQRHSRKRGPNYGEIINKLSEFPPLAEKIPSQPYKMYVLGGERCTKALHHTPRAS